MREPRPSIAFGSEMSGNQVKSETWRITWFLLSEKKASEPTFFLVLN